MPENNSPVLSQCLVNSLGRFAVVMCHSSRTTTVNYFILVNEWSTWSFENEVLHSGTVRALSTSSSSFTLSSSSTSFRSLFQYRALKKIDKDRFLLIRILIYQSLSIFINFLKNHHFLSKQWKIVLEAPLTIF